MSRDADYDLCDHCLPRFACDQCYAAQATLDDLRDADAEQAWEMATDR